MAVQLILMFQYAVHSIRTHSAITPGFAALKGEVKTDARHKELVEEAGGEFLPLVVDNFGVWTPSSIEILCSIARSSTVRNGLSTSKAFRHLVERLSVQSYQYNAKMVLWFWALHPHSEDDWLLGCPDESDCLLEEDICLENLPQDVAEGVSIPDRPGDCEEVWEDGCKAQEGDTSFVQSSFTIPINNTFSLLSDEHIPLNPEGSDPHETDIESSKAPSTSSNAEAGNKRFWTAESGHCHCCRAEIRSK